ncbi:VOC family protein [Georgenia thermotolerans]|uniref:VOC family protein n=1 Tax=Georgenia thermotolerans TaxID=527326 RepID=A0A7J5UNI6_9MICO|nr:VOC family protein [Georgenia thermotolerans]KAE8763962.1 VOC family protein [Georgenia thermotolerans]
MSGRVVHFEIPFDDAGRARRFYREAFGWQIQDLPELSYHMVSTGPVPEGGGMPTEPGYIGGGMMQRQGEITSPVVTVDVEDIDAALETIAALGGQTVLGRQPVGDMGFAAYFRDPEGNIVGLWQTAQAGAAGGATEGAAGTTEGGQRLTPAEELDAAQGGGQQEGGPTTSEPTG